MFAGNPYIETNIEYTNYYWGELKANVFQFLLNFLDFKEGIIHTQALCLDANNIKKPSGKTKDKPEPKGSKI